MGFYRILFNILLLTKSRVNPSISTHGNITWICIKAGSLTMIYIRDRDLCASLEQYLELLHRLDPYFLLRNRDEICLYFQNNIGFMGVPGRQPLQKIDQRGGMTAKNEWSLRCVIRYPLFFGWLELVLRRLRRPECPAGPVLVEIW